MANGIGDLGAGFPIKGWKRQARWPIIATFIGGQLLGVIPSAMLLPVLTVILLISAVKVWRHA